MEKCNVLIMPVEEKHIADCVRIALSVYEDIHESYRELLGKDLHDEFLHDWKESKARGVTKQLRGENGDVGFVAIMNDQVVGYVSYSIQGNVGTIGNNAVDPKYRGNGIAGLLYNTVLNDMKKRGAVFATVTTGGDRGHAPARRAYEKAGFSKNLPSVRYIMKLDTL